MLLWNYEVVYLGFRLTPDGVQPGKDKLKALQSVKVSETKEEIKSIMGLCNFFRSHMKDLAKICEPLHKASRKDADYKKNLSQASPWNHSISQRHYSAQNQSWQIQSQTEHMHWL
jgi:hypothetical protein